MAKVQFEVPCSHKTNQFQSITFIGFSQVDTQLLVFILGQFRQFASQVLAMEMGIQPVLPAAGEVVALVANPFEVVRTDGVPPLPLAGSLTGRRFI